MNTPVTLPEPGELHLWLISLDAGSHSIESLLVNLSDDERGRASRLLIPKVRDHFIIARGVLRTILGETLSVPPYRLEFDYGPHGKPELRDAGEAEIRFNLSHSADLALLAINRTCPIGVDIERVRPERPLLKLAERFFSEREREELRSLPDDSVTDGFYACWTRKEAYLKAIGTGLATPLNAFDVTLKPGAPPSLVGQRLDPSELSRWRILNVDVATGYRAAVATRWESPRIISRQWTAPPPSA